MTNYGKEAEIGLERLSFGGLSQPKELDIPNSHNTFEGLSFWGIAWDGTLALKQLK